MVEGVPVLAGRERQRFVDLEKRGGLGLAGELIGEVKRVGNMNDRVWTCVLEVGRRSEVGRKSWTLE